MAAAKRSTSTRSERPAAGHCRSRPSVHPTALLMARPAARARPIVGRSLAIPEALLERLRRIARAAPPTNGRSALESVAKANGLDTPAGGTGRYACQG